MHTPRVHKMDARLVHVHTFWDDRESDVGRCGNLVCWHMYLQGVCICANMLAHVDTGWYMYQLGGAV